MTRASTFSRVRIFLLSYIAAVAFLSFAVCLFVIPTAGSKALTLAVVSGESLLTSGATFLAVAGSRLRCCRCARTQHVGLEVLWTAALLAVVIVDTLLAAHIAGPQNDSSSSVALDATAAITLSNILVTASGSIAVVLTVYAGLLTTLAAYTHVRSRAISVWFADVASRNPPFLYPHCLYWLRAGLLDDDNDAGVRELAFGADPRIMLLPASPLLPEYRLQHGTARNTVATFHPLGCTCEEKLVPVPTQPEEFRELHRVYRNSRTAAALENGGPREAVYVSRWSWVGGATQSGHRRAASAPVPMVRLPTERDQRLSLYYIGYDTG